MKYTSLIVASMMMFATSQACANVVWSGVDWNAYGSADMAVPGDLVVTPVGTNYGAAHYNTPTDFRNAPGQMVTVGFVDVLAGSQIQMWIEDEHYSTSYLPEGNGAWTQFGAWAIHDNYQVYWWDYDTYLADQTTGWGYIDTGIERTAGDHEISIAMRDDGTVDYWLDGALVVSTTLITPNYFGDVYLGTRYAGGTFTSYATSTGYVGPASVPEPATLFLLGGGLLAVGAARRKRKAA